MHETVGYVGLGQIFRGPFRSCYIGYWIGDPYSARGTARRECERACRRHLHLNSEGGLGLHRVEANIIPTNHASIALVRRVGMRKEGYSPRYLEINGEWQDHERWAITIEDWEAAAPHHVDNAMRTVSV